MNALATTINQAIFNNSLLHLLTLYIRCWMKHTFATFCNFYKQLHILCIMFLTSFTHFSSLTLTQPTIQPTSTPKGKIL